MTSDNKTIELDKIERVTLKLSGMSCTNCANAVEKALDKTEGVTDVSVNFAVEKAYVDYDPTLVSREDLIATVKRAGYEAEASEQDKDKNATMKIAGMSCSSCAQRVEKNIANLEGVSKVNVNYGTEKANVSYNPQKVKLTDLKQIVEKTGYKVIEEQGDNQQGKDADEEKMETAAKKMWSSVVFASIIMALMMVHMFIIEIPYYFPIISVLAFFPIVIIGWETHVSSWRAVRNLSPNMDTLVTMGSIIPYGLNLLGFWLPISSFVEMAAMIMTFHMVGRFLEAKAKGKASQAIKKLLEMGAKTARILVDGVEKEIPVDELQLGDVMVIRPGEKVPTDGIIISGESSLDESMATGESLPVNRKVDDQVIGSTINKQGMLHVKATKVGKDTFLSQVIKMVEECQGSKVPIQEFADRVTGFFVPIVILLSLSAFILWMSFPDFFVPILQYFNFPWTMVDLPILSLSLLAMIAVLVISCPCALGLATPTAIMVGSGKGAENGVLIRRGEAIQTIMNTSIIAFDKTGTLTKGKPEVTDILSYGEFSEKDVLYYAASIEVSSEHPLGQSIVEQAKAKDISLTSVESFSSITGMGVKGTINDKSVLIGNRKLMTENNIDHQAIADSMEKLEHEAKTAMLLAVDGKLAGIVAVADTLKDDAALVIQELESMGIKTAMITGDNQRTANAIAKKAGISRVLAEVLPDGKVDEIIRLQKEYDTVAMVGDGINDAPALKQANVGIAIGTGTDIAIEAADITLVRGDLSSVISAIKLSRATFTKIKQNYFWAWFYNGIAIPAAFFGLIHPIVGAAAMAISSISVVLNSTQLRKADIDPSYYRK